MQIDYDIRANALVEALPYLQEYNDKVVVVKYGGNAMTNETLKQAVMQDIVLLSLVGIKVVLVHGGGPEINAMLKKINKQSEFVNGLRYTDEETIRHRSDGSRRQGKQRPGAAPPACRRQGDGSLRP